MFYLPIEGPPEIGERPIGHHRPGLILDVVEQSNDVGASQTVDRHVAKARSDVPVECALDLARRAQAMDAALNKAVEHDVERVDRPSALGETTGS